MTQMRRQSLVAYGQPLCETVVDCPAPARQRSARAHRALRRVPFRPAHAGRLFRARRRQEARRHRGPHAAVHARPRDRRRDRKRGRGGRRRRCIGRRVAVYPWIGCGTCAACRAGEENLCSAHRHLGIAADGGFATHVLVPHPRYLLDYAPLSAGFRRAADVLGADRLFGAQAACRPRRSAARCCSSASAASA